MSLANFPQRYAADADALDWWIDMHRSAIAGSEDTRPAVLDLAQQLLATQSRERLAGMLTVALHRAADGDPDLDVVEWQQRATRYLTAYRSARERAAADRTALVEADEERDALRAALAAAELEIAQLRGVA